MVIRRDDLDGSAIRALLAEHLRCMSLVSPPESRHALTIDELKGPGVTFWSIWDGASLAGCGALKELDATHGEIKSMRTAAVWLRKGVASQMLQHLIAEAKRRNYAQLSLETGSMDYFEPARSLYARFGFRPSGPFASYRQDPNSVFMTRVL